METPYRYRPSSYTEVIANEKYGIECFYQTTPHFAAIFYYGKKKNHTFHYRFRKFEDMMSRINETMNNIIANVDSENARREVKRKLTSEMKASDHFKIGEIVVNSWGYDQTNVEFYQVVEVLNKKIRVRQICAEMVEATGPMSANVMPCKDNFCKDEAFLLSLKMDTDNKCRICNPASYYYFSKWDGKPEYCSWYA